MFGSLPLGCNVSVLCQSAVTGNNKSCPNRWADQTNGSGVSGPPTQDPSSTTSLVNLYVPGSMTNVINNWKQPVGGGTACPWVINNCGPHGEPYSQHSGGCHAVLGDGSVRFLSENLDIQVLRRLCDRADGETVGEF